MGKGPLELIGDGALPDRLRGAGHDLELVDVPAPAEDHEVGRIFESESLGRPRSRRTLGVR